MKNLKRSSFTLIEILVVIAIIAVLAGMVFGAIAVVNKKQKQVKTIALMKQLEIAIGAYQTTYGVLPFTLELGTDKDVITVDYDENGTFNGSLDPSASSNADSFYAKLLACLSADSANYPSGINYNPRKQKFLELDKSNEYKDAYGQNFIVSLDLNYDDEINATYVIGEPGVLRRNIIIFSAGRDLKYSSTATDSTNDDNITSWD